MNDIAVTYRKNLPPLPERMRGLPLNYQGYPVPWFVDWIIRDGKRVPEFRAMDPRKWSLAVKHKRCWLCGEPLGKHMTFVAGPMCGINRTSAEPPSHLECADYAARACPFLTLPKSVRRESGMPDELKLKNHGGTYEGQNVIGGVGITRNPGVAMLWTTLAYQVVRDHRVGYIIKIGDPEHVRWYAEGREATRAEVEESIRTGLPLLRSLIPANDSTQHAALDRMAEGFAKWLPGVAA